MDGAEQEMERVAIVFCSHDRVHAGWAYDYARLSAHFVATGGFIPELGKRFALSFNWCQTSMLPEGRQKLVEDMKGRHNVTKILWTDTDMRFPKEGLHMLLRHNVPIVGANYVTRRPPFRWTAAATATAHLETKPGAKGIVEVDHLGFGFLLTDVSVFEGDGPHFTFDWYRDDAGTWRQVGEDVFFCREARTRGHKIYVDQELSCQIGHIGEFEYNAEIMQQVEEAVT